MVNERRFQVRDSQPLFEFLLANLDRSRTGIKKLLKFGAVQVNGAPVQHFEHLLLAGDELTVGRLSEVAADRRLKRARIEPVYEDDAIIVVEKPCGLLTVATARETEDTLFVRLNEYMKQRDSRRSERVHVVHRLDQETSGLVLFAKTDRVKRTLQKEWRAVEKIYSAIVQGCPHLERGTISNQLRENPKSLKVHSSQKPRPKSRAATTLYQLIKTNGSYSLLEVRLETGRKHQIRVHLASLGCPIIGDRRYGTFSKPCDRLALHASGLELTHPLTGERLEFSSPLPKVFQKLLAW